MSVEVFGIKQVSQALSTLGKDIVGAGARGPVAKATRATVKPIQLTAIAKAPEGLEGVTSDDPGKLKRNIMIRRITKPEQYGVNGEMYEVYVRANRNKDKDNKNNAWYWHFVEFGTSKQPPKQYLRPALDQHRGGMAFVWTREFIKEFDDIQKKLEREAKRNSSSQTNRLSGVQSTLMQGGS